MAYPQQSGMYQRPSWGGYAGQSSGGGGSPRASWYQGGSSDMSQNPAYRGPTTWGGERAPALPSAPAVDGTTPAPVAPAAPAAAPHTPLSYIPNPGPNPFGRESHGPIPGVVGNWSNGQPMLSPNGQPWDPNHVAANPMDLSNPLAAALSPNARNNNNNGGGSGTSAGVTMVPGFGPGYALPQGVYFDSNGGNFYQMLQQNPQIPQYMSQGNGNWNQISGTPTPMNPNAIFTQQDLQNMGVTFDPNLGAPISATQWSINQNAA